MKRKTKNTTFLLYLDQLEYLQHVKNKSGFARDAIDEKIHGIRLAQNEISEEQRFILLNKQLSSAQKNLEAFKRDPDYLKTCQTLNDIVALKYAVATIARRCLVSVPKLSTLTEEEWRGFGRGSWMYFKGGIKAVPRICRNSTTAKNIYEIWLHLSKDRERLLKLKEAYEKETQRKVAEIKDLEMSIHQYINTPSPLEDSEHLPLKAENRLEPRKLKGKSSEQKTESAMRVSVGVV